MADKQDKKEEIENIDALEEMVQPYDPSNYNVLPDELYNQAIARFIKENKGLFRSGHER